MRFKFAAIALTGMFIMTGCSSVVSLQPIVSEKEATTDPALPGTWTDDEGKDTFVIRQNGEAYSVTYVEKSGAAYKFNARLWRIGDALLLDLVTTSEAPFHIPVHFAMRIWIDRDTLRMASFDTDWFKKQVAEMLDTRKVDDRTVITAPHPAIRDFYEAQAGNDKAHGEADTLHRIGQ